MTTDPHSALATRAIHGSTLKDAHGSPHLPVYTTPEECARRGIADSMLRLSIGLEDPADLIADLEQALA